ncbi:unnamed protein product [Adineta ricciae]|uniref:Uncharacterized protein n=1 Tax=Adineta ricciae TaxID=249248 RepID=A0A815P0X8_ADIRI|nr:unnamed protein product [Adineta ricciae]CAF1606068.1 unnamed protein product [Adineta ricciae]
MAVHALEKSGNSQWGVRARADRMKRHHRAVVVAIELIVNLPNLVRFNHMETNERETLARFEEHSNSGIRHPNTTMSFKKENQSIPLSKHDVQKTLRTFCTTENDEHNIRLAVSKVVTIHDGEKETTIVLPKESITTRDLLKLINTDRCLTAKETKRIRKENEVISFIQKDKFLLVDRKDVCHVAITSSAFVVENCFSSNATIVDVCNKQQINLDAQYLLYLNQIIAAKETQLIYFMAETPIHFTTTENSLPVTVRVNLDEHGKIIQFSCHRIMTVERLCFISCRLFSMSEDNAQLRLIDGTNPDEGLSMNDMDATRTNFEFLLHSPPYLSCSITYLDRTIVLPCHSEQLISSLAKKFFEQLSIDFDRIDQFELFALDKDKTLLRFDMFVGDIKNVFPPPSSSNVAVEQKEKNFR